MFPMSGGIPDLRVRQGSMLSMATPGLSHQYVPATSVFPLLTRRLKCETLVRARTEIP